MIATPDLNKPPHCQPRVTLDISSFSMFFFFFFFANQINLKYYKTCGNDMFGRWNDLKIAIMWLKGQALLLLLLVFNVVALQQFFSSEWIFCGMFNNILIFMGIYMTVAPSVGQLQTVVALGRWCSLIDKHTWIYNQLIVKNHVWL